MRARYYEPGSGRFISEDTGLSGKNWFVYASNNPVSVIDRTGQSPIVMWELFGGCFAAAAMLSMLWFMSEPDPKLTVLQAYAIVGLCGLAITCFSNALGNTQTENMFWNGQGSSAVSLLGDVGFILAEAVAIKYGLNTQAGVAVAACFTYQLILLGALLAIADTD